MKIKIVKLNRQKRVDVISKEHTVKIEMKNENAVSIYIDNIHILVQNHYTIMPDDITVYTSDVEIRDYSGSKEIKLKKVPHKF